MFSNESELQKLIDQNTEVVSNALMEISHELHGSSVPHLVSLGREVALNSGYVDNLLIDAQGVLTIVECKLHSNPALKREVYSQAVNYAADIQAHLRNYNYALDNRSFQSAFTELLLKRTSQYDDFQAMVEDLKADPFLDRYRKAEWEEQFKIRLQQNIEQGIFRIVIACGPHKAQNFHLSHVQNLMKIMQFSEHSNAPYDLSLIDIRGEESSWVSKVIWRRYFDLPQVPLIYQSSRNTTAKIEEVHALVNAWSQAKQHHYHSLLELLQRSEIDMVQTTQGLALYSQGRSLYIELLISKMSFKIRRVQIDPSGNLGEMISTGEVDSRFTQFDVETKKVKSTASAQGFKYHLILNLNDKVDVSHIKDAIYKLRDNDGLVDSIC